MAMPAASAFAMALGVFAIGANLLLTSLVCNEIASTWSELNTEMAEIQSSIEIVSRTVEELKPISRVARESPTLLDGEASAKSAYIARRRLLNKLRHRSLPSYEIIGDSGDSDEVGTDDPTKTTCNCKNFKNRCPRGPPGPKGKQGSKGLNGKEGRLGYPGLPGPSFHKHYGPPHCVLCAAGPRGLAGKAGPRGVPGATGPPGQGGVHGRDGMKGPPGPIGQAGKEGAHGKPGLEGESGVPAEKISPTPGEKGAPGPHGSVGPPGDNGDTGAPGNGTQGPPGQQGVEGREGRQGKPGPPGKPGPEGERVCECFIYLPQEQLPTTELPELPVVESLRADIRRAPHHPNEEPVASQISIGKTGDNVFSNDRKILYKYNQSGLVNISQAQTPLAVFPPVQAVSTEKKHMTPTATALPEPVPKYRYLNDKEAAEFIPANIFTKRQKARGTKTFKVDARAFAVENDLLAIQKPLRASKSDRKAGNHHAQKVTPKRRRYRVRRIHVYRPSLGPMRPLSQASSVRIVRSRRKQAPARPEMWNNKQQP